MEKTLKKNENAQLGISAFNSIADVPTVSNILCGFFKLDTKTSSATKCKCGREKWEHPKAT